MELTSLTIDYDQWIIWPQPEIQVVTTKAGQWEVLPPMMEARQYTSAGVWDMTKQL